MAGCFWVEAPRPGELWGVCSLLTTGSGCFSVPLGRQEPAQARGALSRWRWVQGPERGSKSRVLGTIVTNEGPGTRPHSQRLALGTPEDSVLGLWFPPLEPGQEQKSLPQEGLASLPCSPGGPGSSPVGPCVPLARPGRRGHAWLLTSVPVSLPHRWEVTSDSGVTDFLASSRACDLRAGFSFLEETFGVREPSGPGASPSGEVCWMPPSSGEA